MTPNFLFLFCIWISKIRSTLRWFQVRWNNWKKCTQKTLFAKHANCSYFLNSFKIKVRFWLVLIPIFKFCEEKVFCLQGSYTSATSQARLHGVLGQTSIDVWPNTSFNHVWKHHVWNVFECDTVATVAEKLVYNCTKKKKEMTNVYSEVGPWIFL
jgi:hypothetical protein